MNYIRQLDAFGVPIQLTYENNSNYKSVFGSVTTLIIYGFGLIYAVYIIVLWRLGEILPKIQSTQTMLKSGSIEFEAEFITFTDIGSDDDPFQEQNNIITPILMEYKGNQSVVTPIFSDSTGQVKLADMSINISSEDPFKPNDSVQYALLFAICNQNSLNVKCASDAEINDFFARNPSTIGFNVNLKDYDIKKKVELQVQKSEYLPLEEQSTFYALVNFKTVSQQIDYGIITNQYEERLLINDYNIATQSVSKAYIYKSFKINALCFISFGVDNVQRLENIIHPKLGEILAQIGSIVSLLLVSKSVVIIMNQKLFDSNLVTNFIKMFYQIKQLTIKRNIVRKIVEVHINQSNVDANKFSDFLDEIQLQIQQLFNINQIIYRIFNTEQLLLKLCKQLNIDSEKLNAEAPIGFRDINSLKNMEINSGLREENYLQGQRLKGFK